MTQIMILLSWATGSAVSAELLGYLLHRLLHSGWIAFLSRNHMRHHLVIYGPLQEQRSQTYLDATDNSEIWCQFVSWPTCRANAGSSSTIERRKASRPAARIR